MSSKHTKVPLSTRASMSADVMAKSKLDELGNMVITCGSNFFRMNGKGDMLFAVRDGVPCEDALQIASSFLATALKVAEDEAMEKNLSPAFWSVPYLIEMAKGIVDSVSETINVDRNSQQGSAS